MERHEFIASIGRGRPWLLWVGSAISVARPAALPLAVHVAAALKSELTRSEDQDLQAKLGAARSRFERTQIGTDRVPAISMEPAISFEILMQEVDLHTSGLVPTLLSRLYGQAPPNANHRAVNALLAAGVFDVVITTNFDECIESAASRELPVDAPDRGPFEVRPGTLLKLHGTISRWETMAATAAGTSRRAESAPWQASLLRLLRGRDVLCIGYGFRDALDISPILRQAAAERTRFHWATDAERDVGLPFQSVWQTDLRVPERNLLLELARAHGEALGEERDLWPTDAEQLATAQQGMAKSSIAVELTDAQRAASLAALLYWVEEGEASLALFRLAHALEPSRADDHLIASAYARARRYRSAVRAFERMLSRLGDQPDRVLTELDLCMGAGWCARAGGRPGYGQRFYRRAERLLANRGINPEKLPAYLADQYFRSAAGQHVRLAEMSWTTSARQRHLDRATGLLDQLARVPVARRVAPLRELALAEIDLIRGDARSATHRLEAVQATMEVWADPHELAVCRRRLAIANPQKYGALLRDESRRARRRGRWLEWTKIQLGRLGLDQPGRLDPLRWRARNLAIATWDLLKTAVAPN